MFAVKPVFGLDVGAAAGSVDLTMLNATVAEYSIRTPRQDRPLAVIGDPAPIQICSFYEIGNDRERWRRGHVPFRALP